MVRTSSVARDFKKLPIPAKIVFANNVSQLMTTNSAKFNNPDVAILTLNGIITGLSKAAQEAESGDHQKVVAMHSAEKKLETALETEADYVDRISNGDVPTILLSGFKATASQTLPSVAPDAVTGIKITSSQQQGAIHVESDPNKNIWAYMYFVSTTANAIVMDGNQFNMQKNPAVISFITDTHRKIDFTNLPSGQSLCLTIIGINAAGIGAPTAPVTFRTL
jgi:hypothetical protein